MRHEARNRRIVRMFLQGKHAAYIAERFGISERTVHWITRERGVKRSQAKPLPNLAAVVRDYLDRGLPLSGIHAKYGYGEERVARELLRAGIPLRPRGHYARVFTDADESHMANLYLSGATLAEVSLAVGNGDKATIGKILERNGVPRRTTKASRDLRGTWKTRPRRSRVEWP